ncbi:hypothetical protein [Streptomyces griseomycini]|uniref:Uncharacterized protein n=1 Tax=Streptomyces griseomycini TaxID=66895 RepID=A0A7W7PWG6_9ACTN|nr:hypothetical protein [Streptomyces griseomycini]MBB4902554.1 hypothetical protein [Streptomyces griseomycini]GGR52359.1 hypothetical protein GCM10015536_67460 [Streptomyces griseomycini]
MKGIYHLAESSRLYGGLAQWMEAEQRRAAEAARCWAWRCVQARQIVAPTPIPSQLAREWFGVEPADPPQPPPVPESVRLLLSVAAPLLDSRWD